MTKFIPKKLEGSADQWTPRQALMHALTMCDDWTAVVIVAHQKDGTGFGINATPNPIVRNGLAAYAIGDAWDD